MYPIARACAAAMPLLALLGLTASAKAQTAPETVAFLTLGIDATRGSGDDGYFKWVYSSDGKDVLQYQLFGLKHGDKLTDLTITQVAPCEFTITGPQFQNDVIIQRDATLDFTSFSPNQTVRQYRSWPLSKTDFSEEASYVVGGVKVCTKGEVYDFASETMPPAGTCRNELRIFGTKWTDVQKRQLAALDYQRTNFCKPRAF